MSAYSGGSYCSRWHDLLPLHALGTPMGEDTAELRAHLEGCAACRRELEEQREAMALLPLGLVPVQPSPQVRERLMEQLRDGVNSALPVTAIATTRPRSGAMGAQTAAQVAARPPRRAWPYVALAASLLGTIGTSLLAVREHERRVASDQGIALLQSQVRDLSEKDKSLEARLRDSEQNLAFVHARAVQLVQLRATTEGEDATGRVLWDQDRRAWLFVAFRLPPPPADRDYQLWFLVKDKDGTRPVSAGIAAALPTGDLEARVEVPEGLKDISAVALTLEPKGGAERPSTEPLLYGQI